MSHPPSHHEHLRHHNRIREQTTTTVCKTARRKPTPSRGCSSNYIISYSILCKDIRAEQRSHFCGTSSCCCCWSCGLQLSMLLLLLLESHPDASFQFFTFFLLVTSDSFLSSSSFPPHTPSRSILQELSQYSAYTHFLSTVAFSFAKWFLIAMMTFVLLVLTESVVDVKTLQHAKQLGVYNVNDDIDEKVMWLMMMMITMMLMAVCSHETFCDSCTCWVRELHWCMGATSWTSFTSITTTSSTISSLFFAIIAIFSNISNTTSYHAHVVYRYVDWTVHPSAEGCFKGTTYRICYHM